MTFHFLSITLHHIALHYLALPYLTIHCMTMLFSLHFLSSTLHHIALHYLTLPYLTIHCMTLHYILFHSIHPSVRPSIHPSIHTYILTQASIYPYLAMHLHMHESCSKLQIEKRFARYVFFVACLPGPIPIDGRWTQSIAEQQVQRGKCHVGRKQILEVKRGEQGRWFFASRCVCLLVLPSCVSTVIKQTKKVLESVALVLWLFGLGRLRQSVFFHQVLVTFFPQTVYC
jgi:hypothetical protein